MLWNIPVNHCIFQLITIVFYMLFTYFIATVIYVVDLISGTYYRDGDHNKFCYVDVC